MIIDKHASEFESRKNLKRFSEICTCLTFNGFKMKEYIQNVLLGIVIKDDFDVPIIGINNAHYSLDKINNEPISEGEILLNIPSLYLMPGIYKIDLFLGDSIKDIEKIENALTFSMSETAINPTSSTLNYKLNKIFLKDITWQLLKN